MPCTETGFERFSAHARRVCRIEEDLVPGCAAPSARVMSVCLPVRWLFQPLRTYSAGRGSVHCGMPLWTAGITNGPRSTTPAIRYGWEAAVTTVYVAVSKIRCKRTSFCKGVCFFDRKENTSTNTRHKIASVHLKAIGCLYDH